MNDLYEEVSSYTTPVEDYLNGFEEAEAEGDADSQEEDQEDTE